MKLKELIFELEKNFPLENKEPWDPSGYSVKTQQQKRVTGIVFAIDLTKEVLDLAIKNNCNLILTHHPFLFEKDKKTEFSKAPYKKNIIAKLRKNQITAYSMHTNFDSLLYGTSFQIVKYLGLERYFDPNSPKYSAIINKNITFNEVKSLIKDKLNLHSFRINFNPDNLNFNKVAFLSGSGYIGQVIDMKNDIDLFVTSDLKWSDWIAYNQENIKILEIPHLDEEVFAMYFFDVFTQEKTIKNIHLFKTNIPYKNVD